MEQNTNYYIAKFQPIIDACKNKKDYSAAYIRISSCVAGIIIGRGVNQELSDYLAQYPIRNEFYNWWMGIKDNLHAKAY